MRLTRLPQDDVESGNSPVTVEISFVLSKGRKKAKKQPAAETVRKSKTMKRKGDQAPAEDLGLSKKARMFSPSLPEPTNVDDEDDPGSDDSENGNGVGVDDDLAFYEDLEQAILEQRESEDEDEVMENGTRSYPVDDSSEDEVGWTTRI